MKNTRNKFTPALKAKIALEAVHENVTLADIAKRYNVHPNQIYKWKKEFLDNAERVFTAPGHPNDSSQRETELLRKIGELTVERDFLSRGYGRLG